MENKISSTAVPVEILSKVNKIQEVAGKSVCKIRAFREKDNRTCAFYQVEQNETTRFFMITCNHVLPTTSINEIINVVFEFEDYPQMTKFSFSLVKEHVKYVWTSKLYDATVVEIHPAMVKYYTELLGVIFLKVGKVVKNIEIAICQYVRGTLNIAPGDIKSFTGNEVFYRIDSEPGSSGSPLLTWDCEALAMLNENTDGTESGPNAYRKAIILEAVINAYQIDQSDFEENINIFKSQISTLHKELAGLQNFFEEMQRENANLKKENIFLKSGLTTCSTNLNQITEKIETSSMDIAEPMSPSISRAYNASSSQVVTPKGAAAASCSLKLTTRTCFRNLKCNGNNNQTNYVFKLCALSDDEVLLACEPLGLRALNLKTADLSARELSPLKPVCSVAFDAATDTLLLATSARSESVDVVCLVSLQRDADGWSQVDHVHTKLPFNGFWVGLSFAGDSRLLYGQYADKNLYVIHVNADHKLLSVNGIELENPLSSFACTQINGKSLVAITFARRTCEHQCAKRELKCTHELTYVTTKLSVHQLVNNEGKLSLEPIASTELAGKVQAVLFRHNQLLVATWKSIVSCSWSHSGLTSTRKLLGDDDSVCVGDWCLVGDRLLVWDLNSRELKEEN